MFDQLNTSLLKDVASLVALALFTTFVFVLSGAV